MALSIIGTPQAAAATSITLPTHAIGDIIVIYAYRNSSTSIPTKPAASGTVPAWVTIDGPTGANTNSLIACYFVATANNHTSGTWLNATGMAAIVLRGQAIASFLGAHAQSGSTAANSATAPAITPVKTDGTSMFLYFVGHRTVTAWSAAPSGFTTQASFATEDLLATKNSTTTDGSQAFTNTATSSGYRGETIEILASAAYAPSDTGINSFSDTVVRKVIPSVPADTGINSFSDSVATTRNRAINDIGLNSYQNVTPITIHSAKVPNTDQANFPVLISGVYANLATIAHGGLINSSSGFDIIFTSDAAGEVKLDHEIESYDPITGTVNLWVRIPNLSSSVDTTIYMWFGNPGITTSQENKTNVWDSSYKAVFHMPDGTTLNVGDSTLDNIVLANTAVTAAAGKIDGGALFDSSSDVLRVLTSDDRLKFSGDVTVSMWVFPTSFAAEAALFDSLIIGGAGARTDAFVLVQDITDGKIRTFSNNGYHTASVGALTLNAWNHVVVRRSGTTINFYINGSVDATSFTDSINYSSGGLTLGRYSNAASGFFAGTLDELRVSNNARSADWISTEYNNQSSPSTFYALGTTTSKIDSVVPRTVHSLSDTGLSLTESVALVVIRSVNDTGLTVTESVTSTRSRVISDTGLTLSDSIALTITLAISDTGLTFDDSVNKSVSKSAEDTGLTLSDSVELLISRPVEDTGIDSFSDSIDVSAVSHGLTDTGLSFSDSVHRYLPLVGGGFGALAFGWGYFGQASIPVHVPAFYSFDITDDGISSFDDSVNKIVSKSVEDTGLSLTESVTPQVYRPESDTGLTINEYVTLSVGRFISDTGLTFSDSVTPAAGRNATDTGLTLSDSVALLIRRIVSDTGLTFSDSIGEAETKVVTDTGLSFSDIVGLRVSRFVSDTGLTFSDSVVPIQGRSASDTGLTLSDTVTLVIRRSVSDTGLIVSDSLALLISRFVNDTGLSFSDFIEHEVAKELTDTGLSLTDTVALRIGRFVSDDVLFISDTVNKIVPKSIEDTGLTFSDFVQKAVTKYVDDNGLTFSDSVSIVFTYERFVTDTGLNFSEGVRKITHPELTGYLTSHYDSAMFVRWSAYLLEGSDATMSLRLKGYLTTRLERVLHRG